MNKNKLSSWQFAFLICFPILSLYSGIGIYNLTKLVGVDSYLSIVISYFMGMILLILFHYIFQYRSFETILEKNEYIFGKVLGYVINIIMNTLIFFLGIILLYNISNFVISQFLDQTPIWVFMIILGIIVVFNVYQGIVNIARVAVIFLLIVFFLTLLSVFGILPHFQLQNLTPTLEYGMNPVILGSIQITCMNIVPILLLLIVKKDQIHPDKYLKKRMFWLYSLAFLIIFLENVLTIGTLGIYLTRLYQYPEYTVLQKISLFHFIDRIENFIYIKWILTSVISLSLIIYHISQMFPKIKLKISSSIIMLSMIILSISIFETNTYFYTVIYEVFPYICFCLFMIYIIIGINILVRKVIE